MSASGATGEVPSARPMTRFQSSKLYDVGAVAPLVLWYGLSIWGLAPKIAAECAQLRASFTPDTAMEVASEATTLAFLGLQIVLFLIRRLPQAKAPGVAPRLAAVVGSNLQLAFLALPRAAASLPVAAVAIALVAIGTIGSIAAASWLGRSFSIFPQARRLVVSGPYRIVRHPLYLAEQIATLGVALQYAQPWALLIGAASFAAQFPRMHYEEKVLAETYPAYAQYAARTRRLIPCLY